MVDSTLSKKQRASILKSDKFKIYMLGLAEFVRVSRLIEATVYDLFGIDDSQEHTSFSKESLNFELAHDFREVEASWKNLIMKVQNLGCKIELHLDTVTDIRKRRLRKHVVQEGINASLELCALSLQPNLAESNTGPNKTTTIINWEGKKFMACIANLWANKISPDAP